MHCIEQSNNRTFTSIHQNSVGLYSSFNIEYARIIGRILKSNLYCQGSFDDVFETLCCYIRFRIMHQMILPIIYAYSILNKEYDPAKLWYIDLNVWLLDCLMSFKHTVLNFIIAVGCNLWCLPSIGIDLWLCANLDRLCLDHSDSVFWNISTILSCNIEWIWDQSISKSIQWLICVAVLLVVPFWSATLKSVVNI